MRFRVLIVFALFVVMFWIATASPVSACVPMEDTGHCVFIRPVTKLAPPTPVAAAVRPTPVPPRGDSPATARAVQEDWQSLAPGASVWYKTNYSESFRVLEIWLESSVPNALTLSVYSPNEAQELSAATKPVGRATHNKADPENVLYWKAGYAWPGTWYYLITNSTSSPISYRLIQSQQATATKQCHSYWEYLPDGRYVYWTACTGAGD